jgi:hypothetical protein
MSSSPLRLDNPPPQPPDVAAQQGGPFAGVAGMMGQQKPQPPGGPPGDLASGVHPQGALLAQFQAVKKVIEQMSKLDDKMAPFATRALAILQTGVEAAVGGGAGAAASAGQPPISGPGIQSNKAAEGEAGKGFPG